MAIRAICCSGASVGEVAPYLDELYWMDRIAAAPVDMTFIAVLGTVMFLFVCMAFLAELGSIS